MAMQLLSVDEKQYDQSKTFIPERWLKDNTDPKCPHAKDAHPFSYLPFGFGPRYKFHFIRIFNYLINLFQLSECVLDVALLN